MSLIALGDAIRLVRSEREISQEALADAAGIDRSHMGKIERGERNVTILNVKRVATALGLTVAALTDRAGI
ncbi:helix-turn-helix domain-containing protein [Blastomonas sp.]|uniref:helix-turn-helix domain-containing protein n=1 Tax=Blastomonas sp. TaxID=1909299 RepID=UPI00391A6AE1